jgi:hypothetical protein
MSHPAPIKLKNDLFEENCSIFSEEYKLVGAYNSLHILKIIAFMQLNTKFLVCTIHTLDSHKGFGKGLNIASMYKYNGFKRYDAYRSSKNETLETLLHEINKESLRQVAYKLLQPLLIESQIPKKVRTFNKIESSPLKLYVENFKTNYYAYFFKSHTYSLEYSSNRFLNTIAVKYLFLIVGI